MYVALLLYVCGIVSVCMWHCCCMYVALLLYVCGTVSVCMWHCCCMYVALLLYVCGTVRKQTKFKIVFKTIQLCISW
jgi:hypothetical protein